MFIIAAIIGTIIGTIIFGIIEDENTKNFINKIKIFNKTLNA